MHTTYILVLEKSTSSPVALKKKNISMKRGIYLYVGSAKRGMQARLARHARKEKKLFWHIDYVTSRADVTVKAIFLSRQGECVTASEVSSIGEFFGDRLGASDCACRSHFIYVPGKTLKRVKAILDGRGFIRTASWAAAWSVCTRH